MIAVLIFRLADVHQEVIAPYPIRFQTRLLEKVFEDALPNAVDTVSGGGTLENICEWMQGPGLVRLNCVNGIVRLLHFVNFNQRIGNLNIKFFPNSLEHLSVQYCGQRQEISTRTFPRNVSVVNLSGNKFFGTPDLATLPEILQQLFLRKNRLIGPIHLCSLPRYMTFLDLQDNNIDQSVVLYGNIPERMSVIYLQKNSIGKLHSISEILQEHEKSIFFKFPKTKIR